MVPKNGKKRKWSKKVLKDVLRTNFKSLSLRFRSLSTTLERSQIISYCWRAVSLNVLLMWKKVQGKIFGDTVCIDAQIAKLDMIQVTTYTRLKWHCQSETPRLVIDVYVDRLYSIFKTSSLTTWRLNIVGSHSVSHWFDALTTAST